MNVSNNSSSESIVEIVLADLDILTRFIFKWHLRIQTELNNRLSNRFQAKSKAGNASVEMNILKREN